ncbi:unnamed protein product, partial [Staurois parvus]
PGQGRTDHLETQHCPGQIGDRGAPVSLPKLKKAYEKGTRGISWGPLLTPGPRAVPEFPNGQSAPGADIDTAHCSLWGGRNLNGPPVHLHPMAIRSA